MSTAAAKATRKTIAASADGDATESVPTHWDDLATFVRYLEQRYGGQRSLALPRITGRLSGEAVQVLVHRLGTRRPGS